MTPEQFARVEQLFDAACRLPQGERAEFVNRQPRDDAEVLAAVRALLAEDERGAAGSDALSRNLAAARDDAERKRQLVGKLAAAADEHFGSAPSAPKPHAASDGVPTGLAEGPGTRIGPYKLLQQIGEGGFGVVFMAQQEKPVERKVALKIIKLGMDTRQVVARFEQERQALALMDHPNIARVLDAGATDTGRPYFVMDLVKGSPIVEYCDKNNLTIDERLELFAQVCSAVQHAHSKGIIHRDLKPSNILVGTQDGLPQAKVIDFGIAKATNSKLTDKTLFTEHQQIIGTLVYMSPEQAEGSLDIDTRTDVYSLGVLLYELLTGSTPFDSKTLHNAMYGEVQRMIREVDPPKPSTRVSDSHATLASVAARRRVEPKRLGALIRGELDWIVMKALEKDRSRRYETANGPAMDIQRYLAGEAVVAAPPSTTYRLRKFVRRNKGLVAAVAAVAAALLLGLIAFAWQADVARDERDNAVQAQKAEASQRKIADEQRTLAEAQKAEAKARADELKLMADFQAGMLAQIDPTKAGKQLTEDVTAKFAAALAKANVPESERGEQVESFKSQWSRVNATDAARELIDKTILKPAIATIDQQFKDQPLVDAQLRQTLAERYYQIGLYDAALPLQARTLATRRRVLGVEHEGTLNSIERMGNLLRVQGKLAEAEPFCREAMQLSRRVLGEEHRDTLGAIGTLGSLLREQGKLAEAEPYYREALEKLRRTLGDEHRETLTSVGNMGLLLMEQGKLAEAEPYYREALEKRRRILGEEHPDTLAAIGSMGALLQKRGKLAEAEPYLREAMEKRRRVLGEEHPGTLNSISHVGAVLRDQGKLAEAEPYLREVLEKSRRTLGEAHITTLASISNLGMLLQAQGKMAEAEPYYREAVEKSRRFLGEENPNTLMYIGNLGVLLVARGKLAEAEPYLREALEKRRRVLGDEHPNTLSAISSLGALLQLQGKLAEAEPYLRDALEKRRRLSGEDHPDTLIASLHMGKLLRIQSKLAEAEPCLREALDKSRRVLGDQHLVTLHLTNNMAALRVAQGNHAEAVTLLTSIEDKARKAFTGGNAHNLASLLMNLGKARAGLAKDATDFAAAEVNLLEANTIYREAPGATPRDTRACTEALIATCTAWDKAEPGHGHDGKAAQWQAQLEAAK